jgi:hypothetical protein
MIINRFFELEDTALITLFKDGILRMISKSKTERNMLVPP